MVLEKSSGFWELFSKDYKFSPEIQWKQISTKYTLTPGQIESALRSASEIAKIHNSHITEDMISEIVLRENIVKLSTIADKIESFYIWDDLILDEAPKM